MFSDSALPVLNGVSVSIESLMYELRQLGHSVHLFTSAHGLYRDSDPNIYRFAASQTPWTKDYPLAFPPFYPLVHRFRKIKPDIVHSHTPFTIGFVGMRWAESHQIPIVSTYHTHYDKYAHYVPFLPKQYLRYKIAKHTNYYYNNVQHVITPSEASEQWLRRHSVKTSATIVPTGVHAPELLDRAKLRSSEGIGPDSEVLLYCGRVAAEKNLEIVLAASKIIFDQRPSAVLLVVGDGPHLETCAELVRELGIGDRVRFLGSKPRSEIANYYAMADLFLFGSQTETQGLVVLEAMNYGVPCVVVTDGGAAELIEDGVNGFIVHNDPEEMAERAIAILNDTELAARISIQAHRTAKENSVGASAKAILGVYHEVLNGIQHAATVRV